MVDILKLGWVKILNFKFSGDADVLLMLKMKFDQDLCLNLQYDFGKMNATIGSVVPLAMFFPCPGGLLFSTVNITVRVARLDYRQPLSTVYFRTI